MKLINIFLYVIAICAMAISSQAYADKPDRHYHDVQPEIVYLPTETNTVVINNNDSNTALAGASGQHNFKASYNFQWSVATFHLFDADKSAVSFATAKKIGKLFGSVNYTTDGTNSAIGASLGGTF